MAGMKEVNASLNRAEARRLVEVGRQRGLIKGEAAAAPAVAPEPDWISSKEAAAILGICRSSLSSIINYPLAQKILRWRWLTEAQGKRMFTRDSVLAYKKATEDPEYGAKQKG